MKKLNLLLMIALVFGISMQVSAVITHRYDFAVDANDVVGGLDSTLVGDAVVTGGSLVLDGTDDWMEMPGDQIAVDTYDAVSLEMWYTPINGGNASWSMLAYLGGNNADATWMGINYIFMTSARDDNVSRAAISVGDTDAPWGDESGANGPEYDDGLLHHMVATFDANYVTLNIDGQFVSSAPMADETLSGVSQELAYLGKGGYRDDPEWNGSIHEFRIYDKALDPGEIAFTYHFDADNPYAIALRSKLPVYGNDLLVADDPIELSWTPEPWVDAGATYNLYLGSDPNVGDPNKSDVSGFSDLVVTSLVSPTYTIAGGTLGYDTDYYWRVDTVQEDTTVYQGAPSMFATLPDIPYFVEEVPALVVADETDTVTITVNAANTDTYRWYKESDTGTTLSTTDTLVLSTVSIADEDNYFCDISHTDAPAVIVTSDPIQVLARRLMAYWKLDGDMTDSVDEEIPGAVPHDGFMNAGDPDYASDTGDTGIVGDAMRFSNDAEVLEITDSGDYFNYYPYGFTANLWMREIAPSGWRLPMSKFDIGVSGWLFGLDTNTRNQMVWICDSTGTWVDGNTEIDLGDNLWHMITFTYDPSDTTVRLYTDGADPTEQVLDLSVEPLPAGPIFIGGDNAAGTAYAMDGLIDEVKVFSYALSPVEVADLYTAATPEDDFICVEDAENPLEYDLNNDCRVNLADLMELAIQWLECPRVPASACNE